MSALSLRIPDSLHKRIKEIVKKDHVSINQFINSALAEKISVFFSEEYLTERAKRGNRKNYLRILDKVRKIPPQENDKLINR